MAQAFRIGDAECISILVCQQVPIEVEQQRLQKRGGAFLLLVCAQELLEQSYAKLEADGDYAKALQA